jgi:hypothetical protein
VCLAAPFVNKKNARLAYFCGRMGRRKKFLRQCIFLLTTQGCDGTIQTVTKQQRTPSTGVQKMSLKPVKFTPRQLAVHYTARHGLVVSGSEKERWISVQDKQGHWSEAWHLPSCETWAEVYELLKAIEEQHVVILSRPWEVARKSYTGKMKPLAA